MFNTLIPQQNHLSKLLFLTVHRHYVMFNKKASVREAFDFMICNWLFFTNYKRFHYIVTRSFNNIKTARMTR